MKPYKDTFLNRNTRIRRFKQNVSSEELVWHRDRSDRVVKIVEGSGWQLQMDNGLPEKLVAGKEYHIPANNYHRLIKGKTDLVAEIKEDKMKITKRQLRRIVKEEYRRIISENRGARLTLYLKLMGNNAMIEVNETGEGYYPTDYPGFDEFLAEMNDDLGYGPGLHQVNVVDYDDLGFEGNLMDAYGFVMQVMS